MFFSSQRVPKLDDIVADESVRLDEDVEASGFGKEFGEKVHDVRWRYLDKCVEDWRLTMYCRLQLSIFSAHQNVEDSDSDDGSADDESVEQDEEESGEESDEEEKLVHLVQGVKDAMLDSQVDHGSNEPVDEDIDETQGSYIVENEVIKQRVQRERQTRQKEGGKRRSRNTSKLSIKGKLYHKNDW